MRFRAHKKAAFGDQILDIVAVAGDCSVDGDDIGVSFTSDDEISYVTIFEGDLADEVCIGKIDLDSSGAFDFVVNCYVDDDPKIGASIKIVG